MVSAAFICMYGDSWFVGFSFGRHRKASAKPEYGIDYDNNQNCWAEAISERAVAAANMVSKTKNENTNQQKKANHSAHSMGSMRMEIKMKMAKWQAKHPLKQSEKGEQRKPPLRIHFTKRQKRGRGKEKPLEEPFSLALWPICHLPAVNSFPERVSSASVAVDPRKCVKIPHREEESAQGTRYKVSCTKLSHENMKENKVNFFHSSLFSLLSLFSWKLLQVPLVVVCVCCCLFAEGKCWTNCGN